MADWVHTFNGVILIPTGSVTGSSAGRAMLFAKTDGKLYVKNTSGSVSEMGASAGTNPIVREYTSNATWTKPTGLAAALVVCVGAGGGGGSGRRKSGFDVGTGGAGGGGGAIVYRYIPNAKLNSTCAITIGAGGTGGAAVTTNNTNGNGGGNGGDSKFTNNSNGLDMVIAKGGSGAGGGNDTFADPGLGGISYDCTPAYGPFSLQGSYGGSGTTAYSSQQNGGAGLTGGSIYLSIDGKAGCAGGGAGGGIEYSTENDGGPGGVIYDNETYQSVSNYGTYTGTRNATAGDAQGNNILLNFDEVVSNGIGTGGGGGASGNTSGTIAGGNGGNGKNGSGGGGGGCSVNGANSGAGGTGGNGVCFIVEFYGA